MPAPALYHAGATILGMINDVDWGPWQNAVQRSYAFGIDGTSVINGGLVIREITVPFIFWNYNSVYTSQAARDGALAQLELRIGQVGNLQMDTAAETIANLQNCRFAALKQGLGRSDAYHGYWRHIVMVFEQLAPPAQL